MIRRCILFASFILVLPVPSFAMLLYEQPVAFSVQTGSITDVLASSPSRTESWTATGVFNMDGGLARFAVGCTPGGSNNYDVFIYDVTTGTQIAASVANHSACVDFVSSYTVSLSAVNEGGMTILGNDYQLVITSQPVAAVSGSWPVSISGLMFGAYADAGSSAEDLPAFYGIQTRIETVVPPGGSTVPVGTTTVGATGYVNEVDYQAGTHLHILVQPSNLTIGNPLVISSSIQRQYDIPLPSGSFSTSTVVSFPEFGEQNLQISIVRPLGFFGTIASYLGFSAAVQPGVVAATTTRFVVGHLSKIDIAVASTSEALAERMASSTNFDLSGCAPLTFDFMGCVSTLFGWPNSAILGDLATLHDTLFSVAPLGYVTRAVDIFRGAATGTIPTFAFVTPRGFPTQGGTTTISLGDSMAAASGILVNQVKTDAGQNVWDVFMPYFNYMMYLGLILGIIADLVGIEMNRTPEHGTHLGKKDAAASYYNIK